MSEDFACKRFWHPTGTPIDLSDGGFLPDPEGEWSKYVNPDCLPFASIAQAPCLVLLGEPGSGKSHSIRDAYEHRIGVAEGDRALFLDLRSYGSEDRLIIEVFNGPKMQAWLNDDQQRLHLFLDSLDECKLRIKQVGAILAEELQKLPTPRLNLRIACRPGDWPEVLDSGLKRLWAGDSFQSYDLAPLRRTDVRVAATTFVPNPDDFLRELHSRDVVPLAIRPLTLKFLLYSYKNTHSLPPTKAEVYEKGCLYLCEESSRARRDMGEVGRLSADERLTVATRIAAVMMLGNWVAVWDSPDKHLSPPNDIPVIDLIVGAERPNHQDFQVTQAAVNETLGTALYSGRGPHRFAWVHQTFGEYLAARFIRDLPVRQALSLLTHPGDGRVVPQLREVAAWAADLVPGIFRALTLRDPEVLLSADIENASAEDRGALVQTLLDLFDQEKLDNRIDYWRSYRKLRHPGLADQLRPFVRDHRNGPIVRRAAIKIAGECGVTSVQDELIDLALDAAEPEWARVDALYALRNIGDHSARDRLRSLLSPTGSEDADDQVKGCVLDLLWPGQIDLADVFAALSPPKKPHFWGAYQGFVSRLKHALKSEHLPVALEWFEDRSRLGVMDDLDDLEDGIILLAWEHMRLSGIAEKFAAGLACRMNRDDSLLTHRQASDIRSLVAKDADSRRFLLRFLIPRLDELGFIHAIDTGLAVSDDLGWVLDQARQGETSVAKTSWVRLGYRLFNSTNTRHLDHVYAASQAEPVVAEQFEWLLKPVLLDSPEAERLRQELRDVEERAAEWAQHQVKPPPQRRIRDQLERFEAGETDAFWHLNQEMTLKPDSRFYGDGIESDLTALPGWAESDEKTRLRILAAAKQYILCGNPENEEWLGTNKFNCSALAGYRAIRLVQKYEPGWVDACGAEVWSKWTAIILTYPHMADEAEEARRIFMSSGYKSAPDEVVRTLVRVIDHECTKYSRAFTIRCVEHCWDEQLEQGILNKAKDPNLRPDCVAYLLDRLLAHQSEAAKLYAQSLLTLPLSKRSESWMCSVLAATTLALYSSSESWAVVWNAMLSDTEFGREVISRLGSHSDLGEVRIGPGLNEQQLADLFIWLEREYPHSEDPPAYAEGRDTPRGATGQLRDSILYRLTRLGTSESCVQVRRIAEEYPSLAWMKWTIQQAEAVSREKTWVPLTPREVLALARDQSARLVRDGGELLEVLLESLERIESKIHGETPEVHLLWDKSPDGTYRPKDENVLSDYIKNRLDDDLRVRGVVVNREVEIHRPAQGKPGQQTDIHIDAVSRKSDGLGHERITVILETKGCWHSELEDAMKAQLVDRYLRDNQSKFGLYLIGWFNCNKWDRKDYRQGQAEKNGWTLFDARSFFQSQAADLSKSDLLIKSVVLDAALR